MLGANERDCMTGNQLQTIRENLIALDQLAERLERRQHQIRRETAYELGLLVEEAKRTGSRNAA